MAAGSVQVAHMSELCEVCLLPKQPDWEAFVKMFTPQKSVPLDNYVN